MALTRAQLLMGNDQQGAVLPGEVQAVKQGAGIFIDTDGTISVDASTVSGLVKLNSLTAFNGYVWPNTKGGEGQMLTMGIGNNLVWTNGGVFVSGSAPVNPEIGDLWFNCTTGQLLVYEACTSGSPKWTGGAEGLPVNPSDTSAVPTFVSGDGTFANPYICSASSSSTGGAIVVNRVTITDLAPFQFVQIVDLNAVVNGGRFSFSNNVANASGILVFDILFTDNPASLVGVTYTANIKVGYASVYINAAVTTTDVFVLVTPGTITGNNQIGDTLTYSGPTADGGALPYTPTWQWRLFSDGSLLQTGGSTYITTAGELGDSVYVAVTVTDGEGQIVSGTTADFGPISKPPFPNPTPPLIPSTVGVTSCFTWDGADTTLSSDGCLLFNVGGGTFDDGPTPVTNGQIVCTKWSNSAPSVCGNANSGTLIEGCLFDDNFSTCGALTIDRVPSPISFTPVTVAPGGLATSTPVTLTGFNAAAYITVGPGSTGQAMSYLASTDGGLTFQPVPNAGTYTLSILPGQSLIVRFAAGTTGTTTYNFNVQLGDSTGSTTATFAATTTADTFPSTSITFPTDTSGVNAVASSVAWGNGSTNISATGCIEFSVDGGSTFTQNSTPIADGVVLKTRWRASALCADNTNGQTITGSITNNTYTESGSLLINRVPTAVTFNAVSSATTSTQYTSNFTTPAGYNSTGYVTLAAGATLTGVLASVNGNPFVSVPASGDTTLPIEPGQTLQIKGTTGSSFSTTYSATIELGVSGSVSTSTYSVAVGAAVPAITTPSIVTPADGAINVGSSAGLTITSSVYAATGGAGTHASSTWEVYAASPVNPTTTAITAVNSTPNFTYLLERSIRFNSVQNSYFNRSVLANGNRKKFTWSFWVKKVNNGQPQGLFVGGNVSQDQVNFQLDNGSGKIAFTDTIANVTAANLVTSATFTSPVNWINIVLAVDTTSVISSQRIRIFVNGISINSFDTAVYYSANADTSLNTVAPLRIGVNGISITNYLNSYVAGVHFVDGLALTPSSFGELSGTTWVPKEYTGSFGSNGFRLLFDQDPLTVPTANTIGKDSSGNNNNFTPIGVYVGNSADNSVVWNEAPLPTSVNWLAVGTGGFAGSTSETQDGNSGGGGGGGVLTGTISSISSGSLHGFSISTQASSPSVSPALVGVSVNGFPGTAMPGLPGGNTGGSPTGGGTSGSPQSRAGGSGGGGNSQGGGGGGGAGGVGGPGGGWTPGNNGAGVGGIGFATTIRGFSESYGAGGRGGAGGDPFNSPAQRAPGNPGGGMAFGPGGAGVVFGYSDSASVISGFGAGILTYSGPFLNSGVRSYGFFNTWNSTHNTRLRADTMVDSPTRGTQTDTGLGGEVSGNYAVLDSLNSGLSLSNGNLDYTNSGSGLAKATLGLSTGKWYWEIEPDKNCTITGNIGLTKNTTSKTATLGSTADSFGYVTSNGNIITNNSPSGYGSSLPLDGVLGVAFDADNGKLYFSRNGVWQNSSNPVTAVNPAFSSLTSGPYYPSVGIPSNAGQVLSVNFGQRPFVYQAPTGFNAVVENPVETTLTFTDSTGLSSMVVGDVVSEVSGDASAVIGAINTGTSQLTVTGTVGTWTVGSLVQDDTTTIPAPKPSSYPPDPVIYPLLASVTNSTVDLTSFSITKPPLDPNVTYYAVVRYKSNPTIVDSSYSSFSGFTTGNLL